MIGLETQETCIAEEHTARKILVAEDNHVTKDLLKLLLTQRGHRVDMVDNGEAALQALEDNDYDVVLMDFHLPGMDGVEVVSSFRSHANKTRGPRFVAMTSDIKGLLAHATNCESFDELMPKPFDLEDVCNIIEGEFEVKSQTELPAEMPVPSLVPSPVSRMPAKTAKPDAAALRISNPIRELPHKFLLWPEDFDAGRFASRDIQGSLQDGSFDALVVCGEPDIDKLARVWSIGTLHCLPVIDMTGELGPHADMDASGLAPGHSEEIDVLVNNFRKRRARIHHDLLLSNDLGDKLLTRLIVSGGEFKPAYDPNLPGLVRYNAVLDPGVVEAEAAKLYNKGFLDQKLFDRFQHCGRCGSSRLSVREECADCRSPDISEQPYLHHFTCAYHGLESDFRQGDDLICPKCRQELSHFGYDYDKSGSALTCGSCGHTSSELSIGLLCLDCQTHYDGDTVGTRDVFTYTLSEDGRAYIETGQGFLSPKNQILRFAELPIELVVTLNAEFKKFQADGTPFALIDVSYRNEREIVHEHGPAQFNKSRSLFLENLANVLRKKDCVVKGHDYDFALLHGTGIEEAHQALNEIRDRAAELIRIDLGIVMNVHGPEDFA